MLRALIVDDEAPARQRLRRLLEPFEEAGRVEIVAEAADGVEALDRLKAHPVDLLFLDIQMPGLDGFGVLDRLPPEPRPAVLFTTAYDQYALKAFEANAVDYLLKPIEAERLAASIARVEGRQAEAARFEAQERLAELLEYLDQAQLDATPAPTGQAPMKQLTVPGKDRLVVVSTDTIVSAEVQDGITRLFVLDESREGPPTLTRHLVSYTLDALEQRLDPASFMRVHRSALVQVPHIREMIAWFSGRYKLVLTGGHEVVASRARSKELRERLSL